MKSYLTIQLFGILKDRIAPQIVIREPLHSVKELRMFLETNYLHLQKIPYLIAANGVIASGEMLVTPDTEIALLPPFSGG